MKITVEKITSLDLMKEALEFTTPSIRLSRMTLKLAYKREHSIIRLQQFKIKMEGIPSFVSTHLVRHAAVGQFHLVKSNRDDWGGDKGADRNSPVNHFMILNAQHLIDMARKRLCSKAHRRTGLIMRDIVDGVSLVDDDLATMMVPNCFYRGGHCPEAKPCGENRYYMGSVYAAI